MSGNCYSCGCGFSFFKKEHGCKNCGYAFCKDCLTNKTSVPKLENEVHKVCNKCFNVLTGKVKPKETAKYSPPEAYKKRIAALSNPDRKSHNQQPNVPKPSISMTKYKGMDKEDIAIAQRLEKLKKERAAAAPPVPSQKEIEDRLRILKEDQPPPPTESEMRERLAQLKGQDPAIANKPHVFEVDRRMPQQQIDDLMNQIAEEVAIDSHGSENPQDQCLGPIQNNLNVDDGKHAHQFTQNIMPPASDFKSASGEKVDWNEMNALIQQAAKELEIDAQKAIAGLQKDKELWERLEKIREDREKNKKEDNSNTYQCVTAQESYNEESDSENEDMQTKTLIKQLLEEQALDDKVGNIETTASEKGKGGNSSKSKSRKEDVIGGAALGPSDATWSRGSDEDEEDELPWCCICNEDASLRCYGCDGDLYCDRCYREGHDREDYRDHRTSKYQPAKKK